MGKEGGIKTPKFLIKEHQKKKQVLVMLKEHPSTIIFKGSSLEWQTHLAGQTDEVRIIDMSSTMLEQEGIEVAEVETIDK